MLFKTEKSNRKKIKLITTPYGWKKKKIKKLINPIILYSIIIPFFFFFVILAIFFQQYLNLVTKWWIITSISSLASSFPGQEWTPLPNGINVLGFGATCITTMKTKTKKIKKKKEEKMESLSHKHVLQKSCLVLLALRVYTNRTRKQKHTHAHLCQLVDHYYLKSWRIKFLRISKIFWIVMNVPEERQHLPPLWNQVTCDQSGP